ncbi:MAG: FecR domain-containing protein [Candidatus Acidiferrales bacterium]
MKTRAVVLMGSLLVAALPGFAQSAQPAGEVSALLPVAHIERAAARAEARLRDPLLWRDWFETAAQARARLTLLDGSLVNVGSGARLQILEHDQATERSEMELQFGKVRAEVKKRTQAGGRFEVRTSSAVIGVIGTHLYVAAAAALTTVINFDGQVRVRNGDPAVTGEETLAPFELAEIPPGQPPRKRWATLEELLQALRDTLPGLPLAGLPAQARPGSCVSGSASGAVTGAAESALQVVPGGCALPDLTPVRLCVPETAGPGAQDYAVRMADGALRWGSLLVLPPAPLQDAWLLVSSELPPGATQLARLVGRDHQPLAGVPVRLRQGGQETVVQTDENGGFTVHAPEEGTLEVEVSRAQPGSRPPFVELPPIKVAVKAVKDLKMGEEGEFQQPGSFVTVPGEVAKANLGEQSLPIVRTLTRSGQAFSTIPVPRDAPGGGKALELENPSGERRRRVLTVFEIIGGRLDQSQLMSGQPTQGEYYVCVGGTSDQPRKIRARIRAIGPVHFIGRGASGRSFEQTFTAEPGGLLRIPFQIQAEKGSPAGIPFVLQLFLQGG